MKYGDSVLHKNKRYYMWKDLRKVCSGQEKMRKDFEDDREKRENEGWQS